MLKFLSTLIGALISLLLASYLLIFTWIATSRHDSELKSADAIIVLGAAAWGEKPSPAFRKRIDYAIDLYQKNLVKYIIFTGGTPDKNYTSEGEVALKWALDKKVSASAILTETASRNTYENLLFAKNIADKYNLKSFIIVSDVYHLTRTKIISRLLKMQTQTAATPYSNFPNEGRKAKLKSYLKETNSTYLSVLYHFIHPYLSKQNLQNWF